MWPIYLTRLQEWILVLWLVWSTLATSCSLKKTIAVGSSIFALLPPHPKVKHAWWIFIWSICCIRWMLLCLQRKKINQWIMVKEHLCVVVGYCWDKPQCLRLVFCRLQVSGTKTDFETFLTTEGNHPAVLSFFQGFSTQVTWLRGWAWSSRTVVSLPSATPWLRSMAGRQVCSKRTKEEGRLQGFGSQ